MGFFSTAIYLLPSLVFFSFCGIVLAELTKHSKLAQIARSFKSGGYSVRVSKFLIPILISASILTFFLNPRVGITLLTYSLTFLYMVLIARFHEQFKNLVTRMLDRFFVVIFTYSIFFFFLTGMNAGFADLHHRKNDYSATLTNDATHIYLRKFESGILVANQSNYSLDFVPWSRVKVIDRDLKKFYNRSSSCKWFPVTCGWPRHIEVNE